MELIGISLPPVRNFWCSQKWLIVITIPLNLFLKMLSILCVFKSNRFKQLCLSITIYKELTLLSLSEQNSSVVEWQIPNPVSLGKRESSLTWSNLDQVPCCWAISIATECSINQRTGNGCCKTLIASCVAIRKLNN